MTGITTNNLSVKIDNENKISDHETIQITIKENEKGNKQSKTINTLRYTKEHFDELLREVNFDSLYYIDDIETLSFQFEEKLTTCIKRMRQEKIIRDCGCSWYSSNLDRMRREKIEAYKRAVYNDETDAWNRYKCLRNNYKAAINKAKNEYIKSLVVNKSESQRNIWKALKELVIGPKNRGSNDLNVVQFGDHDVMDSSEIAHSFNTYFVESIKDINSSIPVVKFHQMDLATLNTFKFSFCGERILYDTLKRCNNKKDVIGLNCNMIVQSIESIGHILMKLINLSLQNGTFPCWKETVVIPIQKVPNTTKCEEFRPINMLPSYEKVLERIVADQLGEYVENKNLLLEEQSGFRNKHSCETALNWVIFEWKKELDTGKKIIAIFLDFKRAFETLDRDILLKKLKTYGIRGTEHKWFNSYLSGRTQKTRVNGIMSDPIDVELGVPQGSVLGVILFLLYINDIKSVIKHSQLALFADDTLIYICCEKADECIRNIKEDLESIDNWLKINKLKLNVKKTKAMCFNVIDPENLSLGNEKIEYVEKFKYLGVIVDNRLKFHEHADYICGKIAKKIGFLRRIRRYLSLDTTIMLYNSLVLPHFNYCSSLLFAGTAGMKHRLQLLQNKAMRSILKCKWDTPTRYMLEVLQWMNINQRLTYNAMIFVFKIKNNEMPEYLCRNIVYVEDVQPYNLRGNHCFRLQRWNRVSTQNSLLYKGLKFFNGLPNTVKDERVLNCFKRKLIQYILKNVH